MSFLCIGGLIIFNGFYQINTVNLDIFARILFSQNFADAEFCKNKTLAK